MTVQVLDRAQAVTATTGAGSVTLGSAVAPYQSWSAAGAINGTIYSYLIQDTGNAWEIGVGTYSSGVLTRSLIASSTGSLLNLSGSATVSSVIDATSLNALLSGGSGGGGAAFTPPVLSAFTYANQPSGASATSKTWGIQLYSPALSGGFNLNLLEQSAPTAPYTQWLGASFGGSPGVQYSNYGLALADSTGKLVVYDFFAGGSTVNVGEMSYETYSSVSTRASSTGNSPATITPPRLIGVNDDGTNLNFLISYDGVSSFNPISVSRTAYLSSGPTKIGFFTNGYTQAITANFTHWASGLPGPL